MQVPLRTRTTAWGLVVLCMLLCSSGCAHVYVDAEGSSHVVGLVWLTVPRANSTSAGEAIRVRSAGVSLMRSDIGVEFVAGYSDSTLLFLRDNVAVLANALARPDGQLRPQGEQCNVRDFSE
jgi:hypothetical protein